jgi:hypothetical protein
MFLWYVAPGRLVAISGNLKSDMSVWFKQPGEGMIWSIDFLQVKALCHSLIKHFSHQILVSEIE